MAPTDPPDPDSLLMLRAKEGDLGAFERLFRKHARSVVSYVRRFVGTQAVAEEVAQEVFLRVYRAREAYEPRSRFTTFLYRVATNHCLNELRRPSARAYHEPLEGEEGPGARLADPGPRADELSAARELSAAVETALASLPESQRAAVLMLRHQGLSYDEIGEAMGLSVPSVKSLLNRAKTSLRERLAQHLGDDDELQRVDRKG